MQQPSETNSRRFAREAAFQAVYAATVGQQSVRQVLDDLEATVNLGPRAMAFVERLVVGVAGDPTRWDESYEQYLSDAWPLERLAMTDKNALRMACFEFAMLPDMPPKVTISEYVRLAKRYGDENSSRFVHGVLGAVLGNSLKSDWVPPESTEAEDDWVPEPEVVTEVATEEQPESPSPWVLRVAEES